MKKLPFLLIALVLLFSSCVHTTPSESNKLINIPEVDKSTLKETRYSVIKAEKDKREKEERELREKEEEAKSNHDYPSDLSSLNYPHIYTPSKSNLILSGNSFFTLFIPLGEESLSEDEITYIINGIKDIDSPIIALTGSLENQVNFANKYGIDAVTTSSGTLIHQFALENANSEILSLKLKEDKILNISLYDMKPFLPSSLEDLDSSIELLLSEDESLADNMIIYSKQLEAPALFFLSSLSPSSTDWTTFTPYSYRKNVDFIIDSTLINRGWTDVFDASRFSVETKSGITRRNELFSERLDFIYEKGLFIKGAETLQVQGLTDTKGISLILAEFILN